MIEVFATAAVFLVFVGVFFLGLVGMGDNTNHWFADLIALLLIVVGFSGAVTSIWYATTAW